MLLASESTKNGFQETPQIHWEKYKNEHLGLGVQIGSPPGPQDHHNGVPVTLNCQLSGPLLLCRPGYWKLAKVPHGRNCHQVADTS